MANEMSYGVINEQGFPFDEDSNAGFRNLTEEEQKVVIKENDKEVDNK